MNSSYLDLYEQIMLTSYISISAIVLCDPLTKEYLINYARTLIYTTAMSRPSLIAIRSAYELMAEGQAQLV
jgi:8-amino-7-oxononanoate synthase